MWEKYFAELFGREVYKTEHGFISYEITGAYCYIADMYILPEYRKQGAAKFIADGLAVLAREKGCKFFLTSVHSKVKGAETSLLAQLHYGFKIKALEGERITLHKEI
jgi:GNAT superfamily N-acetyltransferase